MADKSTPAAAVNLARAKGAAARKVLRYRTGVAATLAARPHIWREVAAWVRDTCEQYDDGRLCEECADRADLIDIRADQLEKEQRGKA